MELDRTAFAVRDVLNRPRFLPGYGGSFQGKSLHFRFSVALHFFTMESSGSDGRWMDLVTVPDFGVGDKTLMIVMKLAIPRCGSHMTAAIVPVDGFKFNCCMFILRMCPHVSHACNYNQHRTAPVSRGWQFSGDA